MASGRPVVAYLGGGAMETVIPGRTGVFFEDQMWESLADAIIRFHPEDFRPAEILAHAQEFSTERFRDRIAAYVQREYESFMS
jgi:glycosyltransferase involved in cell wall biosynthesis